VFSGLLEKMDLAPRNRRYEGCTDSQFVKRIAEAWGFYGTAQDIEETTVTHEVLVQTADYTDAQFCAKLAHDNGFIFYIDATGLHWKSRRTNSKSKFTFTYRTEMDGAFVCAMLEEPRLEYCAPKSAPTVKSSGMDPNTGEPIKATVNQENNGQPSLGCELEFGQWGLKVVADELDVLEQSWQPGAPVSESVSNQEARAAATRKADAAADADLDALEESWQPWPPVSETMSNRQARATRLEVIAAGLATQAQAEALAKGRHRRNAIGRYKMSFPVLGNPQLQPRCVGTVVGVAEVVDGLYWIKSVETAIAKGEFKQTVAVSRDAPKKVNAAKKTPISNQAPDAGYPTMLEWAVDFDNTSGKLGEHVGWDYSSGGVPKKVVKYGTWSGSSQREYSEDDFHLMSRAEQEDVINSENQSSAFQSEESPSFFS
jgi:hypothetical protein